MVQVTHSRADYKSTLLITGTQSTSISDGKGIVVNGLQTINQVPYNHAITSRGASPYPHTTTIKGHTSQIIIKINHNCWFTTQVLDLAFANE